MYRRYQIVKKTDKEVKPACFFKGLGSSSKYMDKQRVEFSPHIFIDNFLKQNLKVYYYHFYAMFKLNSQFKSTVVSEQFPMLLSVFQNFLDLFQNKKKSTTRCTFNEFRWLSFFC